MSFARMTTRGRITIPKALRESTGMLPGRHVDVTLENGEIFIRLKPIAKRAAKTFRRPATSQQKRRG